MGVLDNGRVWQCNVLISDLYFGDPTKQNSITTGSTTGYSNRNIKSWKITDTMSANGDVAFGSTGSKALNLELFGLSSKSFGTGAIIGVMLSGVAAPKYWYFFVDTAKWTVDYGSTTRYSVSVTAYDAMYYASGKISSVALPSSIEALIESGKATITNCKTIAQYCIRHARYDLIRTRAGELYSETGLEKYRTYSNMLDSNLDDAYVSGTATMDWVCSDNVGKVTIGALPYSGEISITSAMTGRTLLGRMAAMAGKRAYCNNNSSANIGAIEFDNLISGSYSAISTKDVYDNGFVAEGKKSFQYFTNGTVSYGKKTSNGFSTMAINCPDMTQAKINSLGSAYKGTEYEIGSVKFRGDPTLISGMRLNAPDASGATHNMVCTKVVTCYDGGLYQQLYSEGKSDSDIEFEMNSASQKAEDIVDEGGGGGGGGSYQFYHETTSPDTATISVSGKNIQTNGSGIAITGDTSVSGDFTATTGDWRAKVETANGIEIGSNDYNLVLTGTSETVTRGWYCPPRFNANILIKGNLYLKNNSIAAQTVQGDVVGGNYLAFTTEFGLADINGGTPTNPFYLWKIRGTRLQLAGNATFDLTGQSYNATFKFKKIEVSDTATFYRVQTSTIKDRYDTFCQISLGQSTTPGNYCNYDFGSDTLVFYQTTPNYDGDGQYINTTRTRITMNLSADNINDLFTFEQTTS